MESNASKETKRRFFRKTGSIQKSSFDNSSNPNQNLIQSMSPSSMSFDNPYAPVVGMGSSLMNTPRSSMSVPTTRPGTTGNSISLDEYEIKMNRHRHFTETPRRARSAERFDGMRIAFSTPPPGDRSQACAQLREELLARKRGSPQTTRSLNNGVVGVPTRQQQSQLPGTILKGMTSPPPPYATAMTENIASGPPSYRQAVAAASMTLPNVPSSGGKKGNIRSALPNRGTQSFDTNLGMSRSSLRSAASVPAFTDDAICSCSKCQVLQRPNDMGYNNGEYGNDAVYMESQAFLMHEIMTDGMAFCSIV